MDLKKVFNRLVPKHFLASLKSEFGEHLATQPPNNVWKKINYVDDFWQQAVNFVFNISNLLFSQLSPLQIDTHNQW